VCQDSISWWGRGSGYLHYFRYVGSRECYVINQPELDILFRSDASLYYQLGTPWAHMHLQDKYIEKIKRLYNIRGNYMSRIAYEAHIKYQNV